MSNVMTKARREQLLRYYKTFSWAEKAAFQRIGSHRKTDTVIGRDVSRRTFNRLKRRRLVMHMGENKRAMLTYPGEELYTALHPYSKYRVFKKVEV